MNSRDYLTPFAQVNKAICDGADEREVLNMVSKHITETLNIKGCFVKANSPGGDIPTWPENFDLDRSIFRVKFSYGNKLDLLSSFGLSENFIFSELNSNPRSILSQIPDQTYFVQDIHKNKDSLPDDDLEILQQEGVKAFLFFPIEVDREKVGFVATFDNKEGDLSNEDVKFARAISSRALASYFRMQDMEKLLNREKLFLSSFQELANTISSTLIIDKVLQLAVEKITNILGIKGTQLRLLEHKTQELKLAASYGLSQNFENVGPVYSKRSPDSSEAGDVVVIENIDRDERVQYKNELLQEGIGKILTLPLNLRQKNIGELTIFSKGEEREFGEEEVSFVKAIAQQCACAIENARMYQRVKYEYQHLMEDFGYDSSGN